MDTVLAVPVVAQLFLFMLFITSIFAGIILSVSTSKAGCGCFFCFISFILGVCIHIVCVFASLSYFKAFGDHVFMIQFLSLGIVIAIGSAIYKTLNKYY